ncbi:MAG: response regulator [Myxococcales bacterium]|jgi:CheY-like chemotaxis protein|nr:response regulator [Myxococcales bacterium]
MSPRVLVVDDNVDLAENVADILECEGFEAVCSTSPEEALRQVSGEDFDCVVLDVRMPGMDGVELLARIRERLPRAGFVFMTAYATDERLNAAQRSGVLGVLAKPFGPDSLVSLVRRCTEHPSP